jgi:hypothetical protein
MRIGRAPVRVVREMSSLSFSTASLNVSWLLGPVKLLPRLTSKYADVPAGNGFDSPAGVTAIRKTCGLPVAIQPRLAGRTHSLHESRSPRTRVARANADHQRMPVIDRRALVYRTRVRGVHRQFAMSNSMCGSNKTEL